MGEYVEHYGTPRHSGRYPWGSGKNPQRNKNFLTRVDELKKQGLSDTEIARAFELSTTNYRARYKMAREEKKMDDIRRVVRMKDSGMSPAAIAKETGMPESTIRSYLDPTKATRVDKTTTIANNLKDILKDKPYLDVGEGVNRQLNISEEQLKTALAMLEEQGYSVQTLSIKQVTNPDQNTTVRVLANAGTTKKEMFDNREKITSPDGLYFEDYGEKAVHVDPPKSIDSSRISVRYSEDGGGEKDGVIELRPGVDDISLGGRQYAQVRIGVDGTHYMKGMAVYNYDMPEGVDVIFNTSKHEGTPMIGSKDNTVLKPMQKDENGNIDIRNPFGANFRPVKIADSSGEEHQNSINIVNDDEDWDKWQKSLSSQWLSKQPAQLAKRQLTLDYQGRENEFNDIMDIPNPTVKRQLLETFASECDSAAVHLKGAALPRQGSYAILPVMSLSDKEVYAPNYDNGEEVVLVRFPHAGTFEMPRLRVNNNNPEAKDILGTAPQHAIGINSHVAAQLSGADFDGDTVLVIPTKNQNIRSSEPLEQLKNFDPKELYRKSDDMVKTGKSDGFRKGFQMGLVSNLITDMTIMGADTDEIARAVKHSMVVIDAEKHNLDWKQSEIDNGIPELRLRYQGKAGGGAATLISRRKGTAEIPERRKIFNPSNPETQKRENITDEEYESWLSGKDIFRPTGRTYIDKNGKVITAKEKNPPHKILYVDDANEMSSGYLIESVYADYANKCKALADKARSELRKTGRLQQNKEAKDIYKEEVESLNAKLDRASRNAPLERQAQLVAGKNVSAMIQTDPSLKEKDNKDRLKKIRQRELVVARERVGAQRKQIDITEKEWKAIQAGAISDTKLTQILRYADIGDVRRLATPRGNTGMSASARSLARQLIKAGYSPSVVAERVGVSVSTLNKEVGSAKDVRGE